MDLSFDVWLHFTEVDVKMECSLKSYGSRTFRKCNCFLALLHQSPSNSTREPNLRPFQLTRKRDFFRIWGPFGMSRNHYGAKFHETHFSRLTPFPGSRLENDVFFEKLWKVKLSENVIVSSLFCTQLRRTTRTNDKQPRKF